MFIKLTSARDGVTCLTSPDRILTAVWANGATEVMDAINDKCLRVTETPEQILALIEAEKRKELRDEFAGRVAVGIMRTCDETPGTAVTRDDIAMEAYRMADAMLKAREGKCYR